MSFIAIGEKVCSKTDQQTDHWAAIDRKRLALIV
jgi:hypothetical protein